MASSSERTPRSTPVSPDLAAFNTLVERVVTAGVLCRDARCAELSERAARHAAKIWGDHSLVVADLRVTEATSLRELARASTNFSEKEALRRRAWAVLVPVHALLLRRLADNTLLPGTNAEEEVTFFLRTQALARKAEDKTATPSTVLQSLGVLFGYTTLLDAVFHTLSLLMELRRCALPRDNAHSFVLTALNVFPRTVTNALLPSEAALVDLIETHMKPQNFEPSFCAAVLRKWRSKAVADVLHGRGMLQTGVAENRESLAQFQALRQADVEKIGLRECALRSCDKVERTVHEFKQCSGCRSVWYCSLEHQMLDWGAHTNDCKQLDKARKVEEASGAWSRG